MEGRTPPRPLSPREPIGESAERAADALLSAAEPLPYPARMRELALRARRLSASPGWAPLLEELSSRGPDGRRTALHMALAARDLDHVASVLAGPDMELRRAALRAVRKLPLPDEAAAAVLDDAPTDLRRAFYRALLHGRRHALADRLLGGVRDRWGEREAAVLLPACSTEVVERELPGLTHAVVSWRALGKHHPHAVVDAVRRTLADFSGGHMAARWSRAPLTAAAVGAPAAVLALLADEELWDTYQPMLPTAAYAAMRRADRAGTERLVIDRLRGAPAYGFPMGLPDRFLRDCLRAARAADLGRVGRAGRFGRYLAVLAPGAP